MGISIEHNGWNIEGMAVLVLRAMLEDSGGHARRFRELADGALEDYVRRKAYLPVLSKDAESAHMVAFMVKKFIWELEDPFGFVTRDKCEEAAALRKLGALT